MVFSLYKLDIEKYSTSILNIPYTYGYYCTIAFYVTVIKIFSFKYIN